MTRHTELVADTVATHHVASQTRNVERLAAVVALDERSRFHRRNAFILHAAKTQRGLQAQRDFGLHVGQLFLDQLRGGERAAKLLAVHGVLARGVPAEFSGTHGTPGNTVAGAVQAGERTLQTLHFGEGVFFGNEHVIHHDFAGDRSAQADLAVNRRSGQALHALFQYKAADRADGAAFADFLGPDHKYVRDGAVGDPHLRALELVAAVDLVSTSGHASGVGAVVWLGQAEAADVLAAGQLGQVFLLLRFGAEFIDWHHHQRALHAGHGTVTGVHTLDFAGDQAVGHVVQAGAAVLFGNRRAQQTQFAHLAEDGHVGLLMAELLEHAGCQLVLTVRRSRFTNGAFVVGELLFDQEGVIPLKACVGHGVGLQYCCGMSRFCKKGAIKKGSEPRMRLLQCIAWIRE